MNKSRLIDNRDTHPFHHPVFKGASRVPTVFGIPTVIFAGSVLVVAQLAMVFGLVWWLSLAAILPLFAAITRHDDRAFHILWIGIKTRYLNRNKSFWNGSSYTPSTYPKSRTWKSKEMSKGDIALSLKERDVARYVPYTQHISEHVIATDNLEYLAVLKVGGRTAEGYSLAEQSGWIEALNNVLRGLDHSTLGFYSHVIRRRVREYPESEYQNVFAKRFDDAYRGTFDNSTLLVNELYLTVVLRPNNDPALGALASLEKMSNVQRRQWQAEALAKMENVLNALKSGMVRYDVEPLGIVERNGYAFSEPAEFLAHLLNGQRHPVPVTRGGLVEAMVRGRPVFSRWGEVGEMRLTDKTRIFSILEVRDLPESTKAGHLDPLLKLPIELIVSQSYGFFTRAHAQTAIRKHRRLLIDSKDDSESQIEQLRVALDDLAAGRWGFGDYHGTVTVYGNTADEVRKASAEVQGNLANEGVIAKPLGMALEAGFWAQLPGNWRWRPRPMPATTFNFLELSSFHNQLTGKPTGNPWGPAVTMLKTESGSPYWFNFHATLDDVDDTGKRRLGNTTFIGKSGTGKTVLMAMLLTQGEKFGARTVIFDKDRGLQVTVMALGGKYFPLKMGVPTGWSPLQLEPTPTNLAFMRRFITFLAEVRGQPLTVRQHKELHDALGHLTSLMDVPDRRISTLLQYLPNPYTDSGEESLHDRLMPWCEGGDFGWLFDGHTDTLDLSQSRIFGFDMTEFLDYPEVRGATNMYLQYRVDGLVDGSRYIQITDECQHPLKDSFYQKWMQDQSRTIRKKNGVLVFATQEPVALLDNPAGKSLLAQSATLVFLPNPDAKRDEYVGGFGLTESEFNLVKGLGEFSRKMVIKQGENTTVAQLDLHSCVDALQVFSGSEDMALIAEQTVAEYGENPEDWLPIYLERVSAYQ